MGAICKRVFVIGLDGAGNFIKDTPTPNIHGLLEKGSYTYNAQTVFPSISAQCWGSMFHGVDPEKHGLDNEKASDTKYPEDSAYPSFMKLARIIEESCQFESLSLRDPELASAAVEYIRNNPDLTIIYIHFGDPDYTGHEFGYGAHIPEYLHKITEIDGYVGMVLDAKLIEDSLIIITSDHGGGGDHPRGHGSDHPNDMTVFWGCHGPTVAAGKQITEDINIKDTASIVAHALGMTPPQVWEGRVPKELFLE